MPYRCTRMRRQKEAEKVTTCRVALTEEGAEAPPMEEGTFKYAKLPVPFAGN